MRLLLGIALVSAAGLAFEVTLTRLFAISQGYHFGFLAISLALLGFGASGTALAVRPSVTQDDQAAVMRRLAHLSFLFSLALIASYLALNYLPFDAYLIAQEPTQLFWLTLYYLALVAPFFLWGLALGLPLAAMRAQAARVYAANLIGSGLGCIIALGALAMLGTVSAVLVAGLLAALGAFIFSKFNATTNAPIHWFALILVGLLSALLIAPLAFFDLRISPYKGLSQILQFPDARVIWTQSIASSKIDIVASSAVRSAPGLSLAYRGAMPTQRALFVDADGTSPLTDAAPPELLDALPATLAYRLRPNARALILKPGGGLEVHLALNAGAREIVTVEDNPLVADAARQFAPRAFTDPRVQFITEGTRSFVARSRERFDIVHLALSDPFRPVTAGAYALGENYIYTTEAFRDYLDHLNDDGILIVSRWLQMPPTEEARLGALAIAALNTAAPREHLLVFRSFSTVVVMIKRIPFTASEIETARAFLLQRQFDWVAYPGMRAEETNRFNVLRNDEYTAAFQNLLDDERRAQFFTSSAYDVAPTTDDRPFFFHFFKWEQTPQTLALLGKLWQPFGGSGYLILLALLWLSIVASLGLILLPLLALRNLRLAKKSGRRLIYFAGLGIGFLFVELPLIQRFILFLDQPVYAFATVLFTLLIASGAGSALSERLPHRATLALLVVLILLYPLLLPPLFQAFLAAPFLARISVAFIALAPMGFLMGIPFPKGIARLNELAPNLIPLAWGVNGCASVISSILATMGAMSFGFSMVMLAGAGAYIVALFVKE